MPLPRPLTHASDALRKAWPRAWTQASYHERLDAPDGAGSGWLSGRGVGGLRGGLGGLIGIGALVRRSLPQRGTGPARPRRWSGQSFNERLDEAKHRKRR